MRAFGVLGGGLELVFVLSTQGRFFGGSEVSSFCAVDVVVGGGGASTGAAVVGPVCVSETLLSSSLSLA